MGKATRFLPDYMVPAAFVTLDSFPLTPNKNVDRNALPAPDAKSAVSAAFAPPGTEAEQRIADLWGDLLRIPRVGVNDNFFDLGGHSLLVVQLQSRLREFLGLEVSLVELFQYPTVSLLARLADTKGRMKPQLTGSRSSE